MSSLIRQIESRIGVFDCALSYAEDGTEIANTIARILRYQEISIYNYKSEIIAQSGFDLFTIMDYVYGHVRAAIIINSERYRQTKFTTMEYEILCDRQSDMHIYIIENGGCDLAVGMRRASVIQSFNTSAVLNICDDHAMWGTPNHI